jgi:hypothetical protein
VEGIDRIVDPPSVAAVVDIEECAVWKVATENAEVTSLPISSPASSFPFPAGLIVSTEERDGRLLAWGCRITVVL